jgi:hypothetical protein
MQEALSNAQPAFAMQVRMSIDMQPSVVGRVINADPRPDGVAATVSPSVALPGAAGPGVSQKYDFPPSSPPVSIMATEGPSPPKATASESNDAMPQSLPPRPVLEASQAAHPPAESESPVQSAPVRPMPPRRPPQVCAPRPLPAAPPQSRPIELRGTPHRHPSQSAPSACFARATFEDFAGTFGPGFGLHCDALGIRSKRVRCSIIVTRSPP